MNQIEIVNYALTRIGARRTSSLEGTLSEEARVMRELYEDSVREILVMHPWPDVIKRSSAAEVSGGADYSDRDYCYQLPNDIVWLVDVLETTTYKPIRELKTTEAPTPTRKAAWEREGSTIFCDYNPIYIKYVFYPTDAEVMESNLARACALKLAHSASQRIGRSEEVQSYLYQEMMAKVQAAKATSGLDGRGEWHEQKSWGDYR